MNSHERAPQIYTEVQKMCLRWIQKCIQGCLTDKIHYKKISQVHTVTCNWNHNGDIDIFTCLRAFGMSGIVAIIQISVYMPPHHSYSNAFTFNWSLMTCVYKLCYHQFFKVVCAILYKMLMKWNNTSLLICALLESFL